MLIDGKEYITIKEANVLAGFNITDKRKKFLVSYLLVGRVGYISREEVEQLKPNRPSEELLLEGKKYISLNKAEELSGIKLKRKRKKLKTYTLIDNEMGEFSYAYVSLDEIEEIIKLREDTIDVSDIINSNPEWDDGAIYNGIHFLDIEMIKTKDSFFGRNLIYKKDFEKISDYLKTKLDIEKAKSEGRGTELYRIYIKDIPVKPEVASTMSSFNDYVCKRLNGEIRSKKGRNSFKTKTSQRVYARTLANTFQMLLDTFAMDFEKYDEETVNKMVALACGGKKYDRRAVKEFIRFLNEHIRILKLKRNRFNYIEDDKDKKGKKDKNEQCEVYSQEQFLKLWEFLHCSIRKREYLDKILDNKNRLASQRWLYIYLHFCTIWRLGDLIEKLPLPNLSLLNGYGITDGESLFNWLRDDKNIFIDEMGMVITESVKSQVTAFELKISKTNQNLFMEVGRLMSPVLGLLLAICEGHRQLAEQKGYKNYRYDVMLTLNVAQSNVCFIDAKVKEIIGERFQNKKGNRCFNNYIQNYSEDTQNAFAAHMISIMRGYVAEESETTTIYEKRKADGTIDKSVARLFDLGSHAFAKLFMLSLSDNSIKQLDKADQTDLIKSLEMTPYQVEIATKSIFQQSSEVIKLFTKMMVDQKNIRKIIDQLAFGDSYSKHNHARCLFKAMLNAGIGIEDMNDVAKTMSFIEQLKDDRNITNCLYPDTDNCFGCPMLIAEMYFLYELNDVILDALKGLDACDKDNEFECRLYSNLISQAYIPILKEAQIVIGKERVNVFVDMIEIRERLMNLQQAGKIILKEANDDKSSKTIGG